MQTITENTTYNNDIKEVSEMSEEEKYRFSSNVFYNAMEKKYIRKFIFKLYYSDATKYEIADAVKHWGEMNSNQRFDWIHNNIGKMESFNEYVDLVTILKYEKNPKKALDIWKNWQKNKKKENGTQ